MLNIVQMAEFAHTLSLTNLTCTNSLENRINWRPHIEPKFTVLWYYYYYTEGDRFMSINASHDSASTRKCWGSHLRIPTKNVEYSSMFIVMTYQFIYSGPVTFLSPDLPVLTEVTMKRSMVWKCKRCSMSHSGKPWNNCSVCSLLVRKAVIHSQGMTPSAAPQWNGVSNFWCV